ncbi:MAG TPA: ethanolamine ammonia-lyase reactivating factor EutA [Dermatophilaceae bacterium]|nr:ethanolamine ammonia-lyase reactivating factor EutA [Dermatophilaceae bacterium]
MPALGRDVLSVGIDVGTTTTSVVFSHLVLRDVARPGQVPRIQVDEKSIVHRGPVHPTPLTAPDQIDAEGLAELVRTDYAGAGVTPDRIETGAVIVTGEAARARNAEAILRALSGQAGDFVVSVAGPNAEAQIAGRGAGVARWSVDNYEQVTSVDIGGGTSNAAVFNLGRHVSSSAVAVGGRQVEVEPDGTVRRLPPPGRAIAAAAGVPLQEGSVAPMEVLRRFCDVMADLVVDLAEGTRVDVPGVQLTPPLRDTERSTSVFLTGGVGACYYARPPVGTMAEVTAYGDVGPLLADCLHRNERLRRHVVREPPETLAATVLGAAGQTVTLSGSTIWTDRRLLPLTNLPVLRPALPGRGGGPSFAEAVQDALERWDLPADTAAAIVVDLPSGLGFGGLAEVAGEMAAYHDVAGPDRPLVLVMEQDYAQVLGQTIQAARPGLPLVVLDQVGLGEGDYLDIGEPVLDGRAVPLSIKTLVFYD